MLIIEVLFYKPWVYDVSSHGQTQQGSNTAWVALVKLTPVALIT